MKTKLACLLVLPVSLMMTAVAQAAEDAAKQDYMQYCSECHGVGGKGDGPKAQELTRNPSDLTRLAEANGGYFPYVKLRKIIDGRPDKGNIRAHGVEMPVWGNAFQADVSRAGAQIHSEAVVKMRILNIVDYLASIQEIDLLKIEQAK